MVNIRVNFRVNFENGGKENPEKKVFEKNWPRRIPTERFAFWL